MIEHVFFYGTLMSAFRRARALPVDARLVFRARGSIHATLFDLGEYPGAVPAAQGRVLGELHHMSSDADALLAALDEFEGCRPGRPSGGLFVRSEVTVTLDDGLTVQAWAYFYNRSIEQAVRVDSGDYLRHVAGKKAAR